MTIREQLTAEWAREAEFTRRVLQACHDIDTGWTPAGHSCSIGRLALLISRIPAWGGFILDRFTFDLNDEPPLELTSPFSTIREEFAAGADRVVKLIDKSDAEWRAIWSLTRGGKAQFSMPRVTAFRRFVLSRLVHRRGELAAYLEFAQVPVSTLYEEWSPRMAIS